MSVAVNNLDITPFIGLLVTAGTAAAAPESVAVVPALRDV